MRTAVLIDGAFFLRRFRKVFPDRDDRDPQTVADTAHLLAIEHVRRFQRPKNALYRVFFYDAPPAEKRMHHPISRRAIDLGRSEEAVFRKTLHEALKRKRKLALRLGQLSENIEWTLKADCLKALLRGEREWTSLEDSDFQLTVQQKAVDMKVGLDIASLAYKQLVDQIVLVAGDSDFVPAAKLARREGIDFILDPMGQTVNPSLFEHIDGLHSVRLRPLVEAVVAGNGEE